MPWSVYVHFIVGALVQILLNSSGVIPKDGGWFPGLGQVFYCIFLVGHTLLLGLTNMILYVIAKRKNKKANSDCVIVAQEVNKHLKTVVNVGMEEGLYKPMSEMIQLSTEEYEISDDCSGYRYAINKAFKPAKSHVAEVELLCTYAPNDEYGKEGNVPYVAIQTDDIVYCAVEEYEQNNTFEGAIFIEPLEGKFMFRAKCYYYENMMYFYGFQCENEGYLDKAGLCLVYPKEYIDSENEKKLLRMFDDVAKSLKKCL